MMAALPSACLRRMALSSYSNTRSCSASLLPRLHNEPFQFSQVIGGSRRSRSNSTTNKNKHQQHRKANNTNDNRPAGKKRPTIIKSAASPTTMTRKNTNTATLSSTVPTTTTYANVRMAPHMVQNTSSSSSREGIMDYMKNNPLLFAVVVFPTVTMGLLLLVKPTLRPKFMGGGDNTDIESRSFLGSGSGGGSYNIPNEAPVYELANADILDEGKTEEIRARQEAMLLSSLSLSTHTVEDASRSVVAPSSSSSSSFAPRDYADGKEVARSKLGMEEEPTLSTTSVNVVDLFSAIGIRPHPES